jgi:outer membrane protein assembly factor BamB
MSLLLIVTCLGALTTAPAPGQTDGLSATAAALPASNEAMLLFSRVAHAIEQADWRLAIALREQLAATPNELVLAPDARVYYPVWRRLAALFERMPAPGQELYQRLHDAEAAARLAEAAAAGDVPTLRHLFRTYYGSRNWPAVGAELVAQLLDRGRFGAAIETIRMLAAAGVALEPARRAQLVVALAETGQWQAAAELLAELEDDTAGAPGGRGFARTADLRAWFDERRAASADPLARGVFAPELRSGRYWRAALTPAATGGLFEPDGRIAEAVDLRRQMPLLAPVVADETLVVRARGTVWAYDALTLTPRWRAAETTRFGLESGGADWPAMYVEQTGGMGGGRQLSLDAHVLLSNALRHSVGSAHGLVFTIEGLPAPVEEAVRSGGQRWAASDQGPEPNELVARELATGRLAWRRGGDAADSLRGVAFQDVPVTAAGGLCVPFVRGGDIALAVLDPQTGRTIREVPLVGPPTHFDGSGGRCLMVAADGSLYVCTGNGVVAALDRGDLTWKWAATYPSTLGDRRGMAWWLLGDERLDFARQPPVVAGDLLLLAPLDSPFFLALDRHTGRQRWRHARGTYEHLVGTLGPDVLLAGDHVACIDAQDGRTVKWRSVPLVVTGRAAVCGQQVYVPTDTGVVVLDGRTGKVVEAADDRPAGADFAVASPREHLASANLVVGNTALFAVSPNTVVKFADLDATADRCAALLARAPADPRALLARAHVDFLAGRHEPALAALQELEPLDAAMSAGRERLLTDIFVALSQQSDAHADQLAWLRQALDLTRSAETAARLGVLFGNALEADERWEAAVEHYVGMLRAAEPAPVEAPGEPAVRVAAWLHAADRLRGVLARLAPEVANSLVDELVATGDARLLLRLRRATAGAPSRAAVDRALALSGLPPELQLRFLPDEDDEDGAWEQRCALHVARWETHVGLGMLTAALADARQWQAQFAASFPADADTAQPWQAALAARVRRIAAARARLLSADALPFDRHVTGRYQWKLPGAELITDPAQLAVSNPAWILLRKPELILITLHSAVLGREWHQTVDALTAGPAAQASIFDAAAALASGPDYSAIDAGRATWPAVMRDYLAAVPVRGGLVAVGRGVERGGGSRLWEHPVPDWPTIPTNFADLAVATADGVVFAPRPDRVMLIGWADGAVWWERDLGTLRVERLLLAERDVASGQSAARVIIVDQAGTIAALDAATGSRLDTLPLLGGTARAASVVSDTLVVWTEMSVAGFDPRTLEQRWARPSRAAAACRVVAGSSWVAYRLRGQDDWQLLDARAGQPVFTSGLGPLGAEITAAAVVGEQIILAGRDSAADGYEVPVVRLAAFDRAHGRRRWQHELRTAAAANLTQLSAHPDVIPLLEARPVGALSAEPAEYDTLALRLIDRQTGELGPAIDIAQDFRSGRGVCGPSLLATPSRLIVQANGTLAAYGRAPRGAEQ